MKNKRAAVSGDPKNQLDNTTKMLVLSMLTTYPQDRYTLAGAIGISERTVRAAIHDLRQEGHLILSESNGKGYRLGTRREATHFIKEHRKRAYDMLRTANLMESKLPGQMTLEELMEENNNGR